MTWFDAAGAEMTEESWRNGWVRSFGVRWAGDMIPGTDERGQRRVGDTLLLLFNAHHEAIAFRLPATNVNHAWELHFDTAVLEDARNHDKAKRVYHLQPRSMAVLRTVTLGKRVVV